MPLSCQNTHFLITDYLEVGDYCPDEVSSGGPDHDSEQVSARSLGNDTEILTGDVLSL